MSRPDAVTLSVPERYEFQELKGDLAQAVGGKSQRCMCPQCIPSCSCNQCVCACSQPCRAVPLAVEISTRA